MSSPEPSYLPSPLGTHREHDLGAPLRVLPAPPGPRAIGDPDRLAVIDRLALRGHLGDPLLDAIVATVVAACDVPVAVVNIVTPDRQTCPAEIGLGACSTRVPDELSFCVEVVQTGRSLVVPDASADVVYAANPLVVAGSIGAYAGEPLVYGNYVIGALSMFDSSAREFTAQQLDVLRAQALLAMAAVRLRELATRDPLTGLSNRPLLLERAQSALRRRSGGRVVALLALDVVGMGRLNETLGTPAGDLVLRAVADRLQRMCGAADAVARVGGDEFAVLLDDVDSVEQARVRAASFFRAARASLLVQGRPVELQLRCGLTTSEAATADELLAAAERAADAEMTAEHARRPWPRSAEVDELARAIDGDELVLHYQPVVDLSTGLVTGVEALVRWQHPHRGLLMPVDVIPLAEESGLIVQLGDWVLRTGAAQAAEWAARGRPLDVAINLSPLQMAVPGFAEHCTAVFEAVQAPMERLVLEVTESALLDQPQAVQDLTDIRNSGVRLALDDFGTGYSSFSYLRRFPVDVLKIDRSFVAGLGQHPDDDAIVASVMGLARSTGKSVVAEGVETFAQLAHLRALGVQAAQGFLWTRPLPVGALEHWLQQTQPLGHALAEGATSPGGLTAVGVAHGAQQGRIQQMHAEGVPAHTIAAALNAVGSRTPAGMRWHGRSVARVLALEPPGRRTADAGSSVPTGPLRPAASGA